jgi:hydroxymethylglutaryl-CoA reductase
MSGEAFARRFKLAVDVAGADIYRATTHNKGIMNGVDSVIIATGNDFRAVEAASHAFAARNGSYTSLSSCSVDGRIFSFELELPLALGVIGGLTGLHPLAKRSLELLGNPSATKLMSIAAAVGLASNFAAVKSLITSGIQQGHMKMHLHNILKTYNATQSEVEKAPSWFANRKVSNLAVKEFLDGVRG